MSPPAVRVPGLSKSFERDSKSGTNISIAESSTDGADGGFDLATALKSTEHDMRDMRRLGRKQDFKRAYGEWSTLAFTAIVQATWEFVLVSMYDGLYNGGRAGMTWSFIWTFLGFLPIVASLAEMASMAPTSGGQYHWVSEFAPESIQKPLSYFAGWQATLSWQAGNASGPFAMGTLIQALVTMNYPNYEAQNWQGTLMVIANVMLVLGANIYCADWIPSSQIWLGILHIFLFVAVLVPLATLAPHPTSTEVFTEFYNGGGWGNVGLAVMIGQISSIWGCIGSDAAAHMAEEVEDAGRNVPIAMIGSYVGNGILCLAMVIVICFAIPNLQDALNSSYPHLYAFNEAMSPACSSALNALILVVIYGSNVSYLASTGRETFAFARDRGLPFSEWLSAVDDKRKGPRNALIASAGVSVALSLIYIGSDVAFFAIISLNVVALMATYFMSIGCVLWRRSCYPTTLPKARWSLGQWGIPINILGLLYSLWAFFWAFWPESTPVDPSGFNWASVMYLGILIFSTILYVVQGRFRYDGPVVLVQGRNIKQT